MGEQDPVDEGALHGFPPGFFARRFPVKTSPIVSTSSGAPIVVSANQT